MKAFLDMLKPNELIYPNTVAFDWQQTEVSRPQGHPYFHWLQTNQGEGIVEIEEKQIRLSKNDGIMITPFTPHKYNSDQHWTTNFITLCGYATTFFPKQLGEGKYFVIREGKTIKNQIHTLTERLTNNISEDDISLATYQIFLSIRQEIQKNISEKNSTTPIYWEIKRYIDSKFSSKITIISISKYFHISPQYLIKIFKQTIGISPYQYLIKKRISEAKKLLISNRDLLIYEVANLAGFENTSHFIETFKKSEHCTPLEFRTIYYQGRDFNYE